MLQENKSFSLHCSKLCITIIKKDLSNHGIDFLVPYNFKARFIFIFPGVKASTPIIFLFKKLSFGCIRMNKFESNTCRRWWDLNPKSLGSTTILMTAAKPKPVFVNQSKQYVLLSFPFKEL